MKKVSEREPCDKNVTEMRPPRHVNVTIFVRPEDKSNRYWFNYTDQGKRVRRPACNNKVIALDMARDLEAKLNSGQGDPEFMRVREFFAEFLASLTMREATTIRGYERTARLFCNAHGGRLLLDVRPVHIQQFLLKLGDLAPGTKARYFRELHAAFSSAVNWDYLRRNPCKGVRAPKPPIHRPKLLTKQELHRLFSRAEGTPLYPVVLTAAYAGLRRAELVWLEWKDIDFEQGWIHVRNKPDHPLKSHKERAVPLHPKLAEILQKQPREKQWVFPSPEGRRWDLRNFSRKLEPLFRKARIDGGIHRLRHTCASHLLMHQADIVSVKQMLGHAQISTTMGYAGTVEEHLKKQMDKLSYED